MNRKYLLDWAAKCMCVFVFMFVLMGAKIQLCILCERETEKREKENNRRRKKIRRCGSRQLPGIVRIKEERGWPRKSENITEGGSPISGNCTACLTGSNSTFIQSSVSHLVSHSTLLLSGWDKSVHCPFCCRSTTVYEPFAQWRIKTLQQHLLIFVHM